MTRKILLAFLILMSLPTQGRDFCVSVHALNLEGKKPTRICQSQIRSLKARRLDFTYNGPLIARGENSSYDKDWTELRTCNQYLPIGLGQYAGSRMEDWSEYNIYMQTCGTLLAVEHARKSRVSYLNANPVALRFLPPTLLPAFTGDDQDRLVQAERKGDTAASYLNRVNRRDRKEFIDGWSITLLTRADFDGDGIEDAFVSCAYSPPPPMHHFSRQIGVLRRTSAKGRVTFTLYDDFPWYSPQRSRKLPSRSGIRTARHGS